MAEQASGWVRRFLPLAPAGSTVLDVACGKGRHLRHGRGLGLRVVGVDRDLSGVRDLGGDPDVELVGADLEDGSPFPLADRRFGAVVVTRYLHRPLLPALVAAVAPGGVLIYETFSVDQPRLGRPSSPDFLLRPGELLEAVAGSLRVLAYEDLVVEDEQREAGPAALQRICARAEGAA